MSQNARIRGRKLQRIRKQHFRLHPLCVHCAARGLIRPATDLDHIVPIFRGGADDASNRQGLCVECHEVKTRQDLGQGTSIGATQTGMPASASHHWYR